MRPNDGTGLTVVTPIRSKLHGRRIFLAASIPDADYRQQRFDPLEITEATLAIAREILTSDGRILSGGHPAIVPLLFRVAADIGLERLAGPDPIQVYQSGLYADRIPSVTHELANQQFGRIVMTPAAPGDQPVDGRNLASLTILRDTMLDPDRDVAAAVFVGGKAGLAQEWTLFQERYPIAPLYPIAAPGGYSALLADSFLDSSFPLHQLLASRDYGSIADAIVADIAGR